MKISFEIAINAPIESVWNWLIDLSKYPEWNPLIPLAEGSPAPEARLRAVINPMGLNRRKVNAKVTGFVAPKYFSFEDDHRFGSWFYREEFVFRMKPREGGVQFHGEVFVSGLSLQFRRYSVKDAFRRSLLHVCENLKEKAEA